MDITKKYVRSFCLASIAEFYENFDDMMEFLQEMIENQKEDFTKDERDYIIKAIEIKVGRKLEAIEIINNIEKEEQVEYLEYIIEYKGRLIKDLIETLTKIIEKIDSSLIPKCSNLEGKALYLTIKADYQKNIAENIQGEEHKQYLDRSLNSYKEAKETAKNLPAENAVKMRIACDFSIFNWKFFNKKTAERVTRKALKKAQKVLYRCNEDDWDYEDAFKMASKLEHNLNLYEKLSVNYDHEYIPEEVWDKYN